MQKRGGGRFGKYGDLKRKDKIRQAQVLKRDNKAKAGFQTIGRRGPQAGLLLKLKTYGAVEHHPRLDQKPNGEDENS